jgi:hypothetical protein
LKPNEAKHTDGLRRLTGVGLMVLQALAAPARAQSDARLSAGVGIKYFESTGKLRLSPLVRGRRSGFRPAFGFNWERK